MSQSQRDNAWWKSASFIGAIVGAVIVVVLDLTLRAPNGAGWDVVRFVGRFHPLVVHLPIGFLILVGFAEGLSLIRPARARIDPALGLLLPPLLASAVIAFTLGILLARDGGYPSKLVALHRNFTLAAVVGSAVCLAAWSALGPQKDGIRRGIYRAALGATLGLVTIGAHFGGSITRGETYLTKYAPAFARKLMGDVPKETPPPAPTVDASSDPLVYRDVVAPILQLRCAECHGESTRKASLRLDSLEAILKGGENGPVVNAGHSESSSLVERMMLPADKDEHMPPDGKPGPTAEEIEAIRFWVDRGANDTLRVRDALASDGARLVLAKAVSSSTASPPPLPSASSAPSAEPSASAPTTPSPGTSVAVPSSSGTGTSAHTGSAWDDAVEPILMSRCGKCHGAAKQKGKLRLDSIAALGTGGKNGAAIVAGDASSGTLLTRVRLPIESEDHMPPRKEAQLAPEEIELIAYWIQQGANADLKTASVPARLLAASAPPTPTAEPSATPTATPTATTSSTPPDSAVDVSTLPADVHLYTEVVKPIFDQKCSLCHSGEEPSGDLDLDNHAKLLASAAIVPGKPTRSKIVQRVALPLRDPDHMPPDGHDQTERGEVDAMKLWIAKGASEDLVVPAKSLSPDVAYAAASILAKAKNAGVSGGGGGGGGAGAMPEPSASQSPSAVPSALAPPTMSANALVHAPGPPSVGPAPGCAACAVGSEEPPVWMGAGAALVGLGMLLGRRRGRG